MSRGVTTFVKLLYYQCIRTSQRTATRLHFVRLYLLIYRNFFLCDNEHCVLSIYYMDNAFVLCLPRRELESLLGVIRSQISL